MTFEIKISNSKFKFILKDFGLLDALNIFLKEIGLEEII